MTAPDTFILYYVDVSPPILKSLSAHPLCTPLKRAIPSSKVYSQHVLKVETETMLSSNGTLPLCWWTGGMSLSASTIWSLLFYVSRLFNTGLSVVLTPAFARSTNILVSMTLSSSNISLQSIHRWSLQSRLCTFINGLIGTCHFQCRQTTNDEHKIYSLELIWIYLHYPLLAHFERCFAICSS